MNEFLKLNFNYTIWRFCDSLFVVNTLVLYDVLYVYTTYTTRLLFKYEPHPSSETRLQPVCLCVCVYMCIVIVLVVSGLL